MRGGEEVRVKLGHLSTVTIETTWPQPAEVIMVEVHQSKVNKQGSVADRRGCVASPDLLSCAQVHLGITFVSRMVVSKAARPLPSNSAQSPHWCGRHILCLVFDTSSLR